jgi:glycosyltransferase involved in cell wall biosynthesis
VSLFHIDGSREWGGAERQALALARETRKRGFATRLVVQPNGPLHKNAAAEGLPVLPLTMPGGRSFWSAWRLASAMRRERCVLAHFHDAAGQAVGAPAAARARVPVRILSRRTDEAGRAAAVRSEEIDAVIAGSEGLKDVLVRGGLSASAVEVIPAGIDFSPFDKLPSRDFLRQEFSFAADDFVVGVVAGLEDPRGFQELAGAARIIAEHAPKSRVVVLGEGALRLEPDKKGHDVPGDELVYYLGYRDRLPQVLASLDAFVTTSPLIGFGGGLLDAMASRVPVVAAEVGGVPDVLVHRETGLLVPPRDPRALAEAVLKLYLDRALAARLAQHGQEAVRNKYSTEAMAHKTIAVYERLARRKGIKLG